MRAPLTSSLRRVYLPKIDLTWGTADVQCFNPVSMTYSGIILRGMPLYMVHGLHHAAALAEARAGASVVACRLSGISDAVGGDEAEALTTFNAMFQQILECADVYALSCLIVSWDDPNMFKLVAARQREADLGAQMQSMLLEQAGLTDLGVPTWRVPGDLSCDSSFHFEPGNAIRYRLSPLLSDFLCGERPAWRFENAELAGPSVQQGGGASGPEDVHRLVSVPNLFTAPQEDYDE